MKLRLLLFIAICSPYLTGCKPPPNPFQYQAPAECDGVDGSDCLNGSVAVGSDKFYVNTSDNIAAQENQTLTGAVVNGDNMYDQKFVGTVSLSSPDIYASLGTASVSKGKFTVDYTIKSLTGTLNNMGVSQAVTAELLDQNSSTIGTLSLAPRLYFATKGTVEPYAMCDGSIIAGLDYGNGAISPSCLPAG